MRPFWLVLDDDLMSSSRLEAAARHLGYGFRSASTEQAVRSALADGPALVLLSTQHSRLEWASLLPRLRAEGRLPPVLAFGSHVDKATRDRARAAGVDRWVANSRLTTDLPGLVDTLLLGEAAAASDTDDSD